MLGAIKLLEINNNVNPINDLYYSNNITYQIKLGQTSSSINGSDSALRGNTSSEFESSYNFQTLVPYIKEIENETGYSCQFYYKVTNFESTSLGIEFNLGASSDDYFSSDGNYYNMITCPAYSSSYGYFGLNYLDTIANVDSLNYYWVDLLPRSSGDYNLSIYIIPENIEEFSTYTIENFKTLSVAYDEYHYQLDGVFDRGYNTGYSQAMEDSGGTYQEGFEKGQELGYQKAQKEETILTDTFEILHEGISAGSNLLSQKLTPNLTLGQVAFFPVTVTVVLFLIRSLVA